MTADCLRIIVRAETRKLPAHLPGIDLVRRPLCKASMRVMSKTEAIR